MDTTFISNGRDVRLTAHVPGSSGKHPAVLLLHGAGGHTDYWLQRVAPFATQAGFAVFVVHYLDATGDDRAQSFQLMDGIHVPLWLEAARSVLTIIAEHPVVDPSRIAVVGVSLGAFMALALGTRVSPTIRAIVDISGGLISPWKEHLDSSFPPTLILHGASDSVVPVSHARELDSTLTRLGVLHQTVILLGEDHWFTPIASTSLLGHIARFLTTYL